MGKEKSAVREGGILVLGEGADGDSTGRHRTLWPPGQDVENP